MRQMISGLATAVTVMAAAPAMACGYGGCVQPQVYVAPAYSYSGCTPCGGWTHERLPDPELQYSAPHYRLQQYYYVNQGPTYTGPGNWAPVPTYQESAVSGYYRHGYARRHAYARYHYGHRVLRRYY
jgi:hypothetical protein